MLVIEIPNGCCENVNGTISNTFKVPTQIVETKIKKGTMVKVLMNGFVYHCELYHKNKNYLYFYIY